ncbi:hypothetical protein KAJ27_23300 [bacterium]|nr:hypothetical protein [Candidatus Neomarinimicrobiota bacterium]MCK5687084.1 hypothetical protein [bacterium]
MSKKEKKYEKIKKMDNVLYSRSDIESILQKFDLKFRQMGTSHIVVHMPQLSGNTILNYCDEISLPTVKGRYIKKYYVKNLMTLLDELETVIDKTMEEK